MLKKSKNDSSDEEDSDVPIIQDVYQKKLNLDYSSAQLLDPAAQRIEDRFSDVANIPSDEEETALRQRSKPLKIVDGGVYDVLIMADKSMD